ncbi:MAG: hypothetical protein PVI86_04985 [Phycisphaerae bacterium]|jgi:hypothetical protein
MEPIISRTTTERILRTTLVTVLVCVGGIWFLWDGYVGYERDNARQLLRTLGLDPDQAVRVDGELTRENAEALVERFRKGASYGDLESSCGAPSIKKADQAFYLGPGGHLVVSIDGGQVGAIEWVEGVHSEASQALQRLLGYVLGVVGVFMLVRFVDVVTTRVTVTDAGLTIRGHPTIPFSDMKALRADASGKVGLVDLEYDREGKKSVARLDDYVIQEYEAVLSSICEHSGLPDPRKRRDDD